MSDTTAFIAELKLLLLEAVEQQAPVGGLTDDAPLFGPNAQLDLDSLDALQISMAVQRRYGVRMPDSKETRRALASVATLAAHISAWTATHEPAQRP